MERRLTIALALSCGLLWSAGGVTLYWLLRAGLVGEFDQTSQVTVHRLATFTEYSQGRIAFDSSGELLPAFERGERPDYFQVWLPDGSPLARSPSLADDLLPSDAGAPNAPKFWNLDLPDGRPGRAAGIRFVPHEDEDAPEGPGSHGARAEVTLVVARDRADLDIKLRQLVTALFLVGITIVVATSLVAGLVVRRGLKPLSRLAGHAATIDASSLTLRFPTDGMPTELLPIGQRLNDLLARLDVSFARERRFSADVAHELRTPIAELRTLAEVALKWPDDMGTARSALQDALGVALQMESIATGLLALARCEGGLLPVRPEAVPFDSMVEELWQPLADPARAKKLSVTLDVPVGASWHTDPVALRVIVGNLLGNAVEYTPVAGEVRVRFEENNGSGHLLISNTTDHLRSEDLPHLFDRFSRKDPSRTSSAHCGLGLALAKAYAESLGLSVCARMTGTSELTIEVSAASAAAPRYQGIRGHI